MYTSFYNLREKPFNLTPSPRFLYLGESHKEALALLRYGIMERKGFVLLTGEVGTGKTTIVQALLQSLDKNIQIVYLSNPLMKAQDFINYLGFQALSRTEHYKSKAEFLLEFEAFLKTCRRDQRNFVLIVDEAQKLSFSILEEIRLLSNMESAEEKLINIFLVGQPELNERLSDPRCKPLLQRITIRHHIASLNLKEAGDYIITRLAAAGAEKPKEIFSKEVIETIHQYSNGYPRMINVLADNSLLLGYSKRTRKVTPEMVMQSYQDLQLEGSALKATGELSKRGEDQGTIVKRKINWKWVVAAFLLGMGIAAFLIYGKGGMVKFTVLPLASEQSDSLRQGEDKTVVREKLPSLPPIVQQSETTLTPNATERSEVSGLSPRVEPSETLLPPIAAKRSGAIGLSPKVEPSGTILTPVAEKRSDSPLPPDAAKRSETPSTISPQVEQSETLLAPNAAKRSEATSVVVKQGDTLAGLMVSIYGRFDKDLTSLIKKHNPDLVDVNRIVAGQEVIFPAVVNSLRSNTFTVKVSSSRNLDEALQLSARFQKDGKESFIIPTQDPRRGQVFLVTLGLFNDRSSAQSHAARLLQEKVVGKAEVIEVGNTADRRQ